MLAHCMPNLVPDSATTRDLKVLDFSEVQFKAQAFSRSGKNQSKLRTARAAVIYSDT